MNIEEHCLTAVVNNQVRLLPSCLLVNNSCEYSAGSNFYVINATCSMDNVIEITKFLIFSQLETFSPLRVHHHEIDVFIFFP